MRWSNRKNKDWQSWFAWHPVEIGDYYVCFETVERRRVHYGNNIYWQYRELS